jgi:hypothetical protein
LVDDVFEQARQVPRQALDCFLFEQLRAIKELRLYALSRALNPKQEIELAGFRRRFRSPLSWNPF